MTGSLLDSTKSRGLDKRLIRFGAFELRPVERILSEKGRHIPLGDRALDLLLTLIECPGELVSKEELIARAWPRRIVEEVNLRIHIAALRRALGDGRGGSRYIVNVIGRGYSFVGEVSIGSAHSPAPEETPPRRSNLPATLNYLVGREADIEAVDEMLGRRRLVTIIGVGGVGKSTLAVATAAARTCAYRNGTFFVDFTTISDGGLVPLSIATAIGVAVDANDPLPAINAYLRDKDMLLVLDNCEHVIAAAAEITESLLKHSPGLHILATSREPLRTPGECRHRLSALRTPSAADSLDRGSAGKFAAIELFIERAQSADQSFDLTDSNAALVGSICRYLDGIPLAIELAAARVGSMKLSDLVSRLPDEHAAPSLNRRTGVAHHQTLRATLDWSHELLSDREKIVLRRLSIFRGCFNLGLAVGVCAQEGLTEEEATNALLNLVDRSLVASDCSGDQVLHRLLQTTRDYAFDKLMKSSDATSIFRWHAEEVSRQLRQAELDWDVMSRTEWLHSYEYVLDDIRAALNWALSFNGDATLAAQITITAVPFGYQLGLTEEFVDLINQALSALSRGTHSERALEERLRGALLHLSRHLEDGVRDKAPEVSGPDRPGAYQIGFLIIEAIDRIECAQYEEAVDRARRMGEWAYASKDPGALLVAKRVMAQATHFRGDHAAARWLAESVLNSPAAPPLRYVSTPIDHRVSMRIILARILWIEGYADRARDTAERALEYAEADNPFALCQALALAACPIALWRGDLEGAARLIARLDEHTRRYRLERWRAYAVYYAACEASHGDADQLVEGYDTPRGVLADMLLTLGSTHARLPNGELAPQRRLSWCGPELLRLEAERLFSQGGLEALEAVEAKLALALDLAEQQNALAWRLRAATSLAGYWRQVRRTREARALLAAVYGRFSEGHRTRDLERARQLIDCL